MSSSRLKDEAADEQYRQCVEKYIDVLDSEKFLSLSSESDACNKNILFVCFVFLKFLFLEDFVWMSPLRKRLRNTMLLSFCSC